MTPASGSESLRLGEILHVYIKPLIGSGELGGGIVYARP